MVKASDAQIKSLETRYEVQSKAFEAQVKLLETRSASLDTKLDAYELPRQQQSAWIKTRP
jgi:hypothetical protein